MGMEAPSLLSILLLLNLKEVITRTNIIIINSSSNLNNKLMIDMLKLKLNSVDIMLEGLLQAGSLSHSAHDQHSVLCLSLISFCSFPLHLILLNFVLSPLLGFGFYSTLLRL